MSNADPASHRDEGIGNSKGDKWDEMLICPVVKGVVERMRKCLLKIMQETK